MPSDFITVNLNNTVTINGEVYYKVYNNYKMEAKLN